MKVVPPEDFLRMKRKPRKIKILAKTSSKRTPDSLLAEKKTRPKRVGTPRPSLTFERTVTSFECGEFWRYFQNASQLAFVVIGGGSAVISRKEARQLLANFRGTNVESIAKTDSGLMHICGLSVRQLHNSINDLWRMGSAGMYVIKDLSVGSTKGLAKKLLLRSQKERIDEHIRSHSVSVLSAVVENDVLELGVDRGTGDELPSLKGAPSLLPLLPPIDTGHMQGLSVISVSQLGDLGASFEDEVKLEQPTMSLLKTVELEFCKSEVMRSSFSDKRKHHSAMDSIAYSLMSWAKEDDVLSLGSLQPDADYDTDSSLECSDEGKSDSHSVADGSLSQESQPGSGMPTPIPSNLELDSEEIIYFDGFDTPRRDSLSFSFSMSERLATIMHAPVGV